MASHKNMFSNLMSDDSDDNKKKKKAPKKAQPQQQYEEAKQTNKEEQKPVIKKPKIKGVPADPHPLDRKSGTGIGKEQKKQGAGQANWGNYKDDLKEIQNEQTKQKLQKDNDYDEDEEEAKNVQTLDEYYEKKGKKQQNAQQQVSHKSQAEIEKLAKAENLQVMHTKEQLKQEDATKDSKQKKHKVEYQVGMHTEHADLLGFTTVTGKKSKKQEGEIDGQQQQVEDPQQKKGEEKKPVEKKEESVNIQDAKTFPEIEEGFQQVNTKKQQKGQPQQQQQSQGKKK